MAGQHEESPSISDEYVELVQLASKNGWATAGGFSSKTGEAHLALQSSTYSMHIPSVLEVSSALAEIQKGETDIIDVSDEIVGSVRETIITFDGNLLPGFRNLVEHLINDSLTAPK